MAIADIESTIISILQTALPDIQIEGFPERPSDYKLMHPIGALLVRYAGAKYGEPLTTNTCMQWRTIEFEIILIMRHLRRDYEGAYAYIDTVRSALIGYAINGQKFYGVKEEFITEMAGVWQFGITFAIKQMSFGQRTNEDPDYNVPLFVQGTAINKTTNDTVEVSK